ncbi:MAG: dihydropteroate synthase [Bacteroidetes bacterium]|nr:dihydropteroate synthase [Bacteroidota bacterium]
MNFSAVQDTIFHHKFTLNCRGKVIPLSTPVVMGIINCTPDSFHSDSRAQTIEAAIQMAQKHLNDGAAILDIGAYSSRPGAENISLEEELNRIVPVVKALREKFPEAIFSIDTFRHEVVEALLPFGVDMVNDISGLADEKILEVIAGKSIPYVLMHNSENANYRNVTAQVYQFFQKKIEVIKKYKITDVVLDLGFGFAKTQEHNFKLLRNVDFFLNQNLPILIGVSRKSMIYKTLNTTPAEALNGTTVVHSIALMKGGNILRVHDVKEAKEAIDLFNKMGEK